MVEKLINIKEVPLKNNCPECYNNNGLRLSIKQNIIETRFYKSITADISHELVCKNCDTIIYPVQRTDDIDRVVEYQKRAFQPKPTSTYLKRASWMAIIGLLLAIVIILLVVFYANL